MQKSVVYHALQSARPGPKPAAPKPVEGAAEAEATEGTLRVRIPLLFVYYAADALDVLH
jgi:hypothetical protein